MDKQDQFIMLDNNESIKIICNRVLFADNINKTQFIKQIDRLNSNYEDEKTLIKGNFLDYFYKNQSQHLFY